jgi:hypothetical protein
VALAALALPACAPKQRLPLDCVPATVTVYVDGRALEGRPASIELKANEPHKIFVKGPGYEPRLVVFEPHYRDDGSLELIPQDACLKLVPVPVERELDLHVEEPKGPKDSK